MADWIILLLLVALGLGGYWLMGRVGDYLAGNLARNTVRTRTVEGWTPQALSYILGREENRAKIKKEGKADGRDASAAAAAGAPRGCAG